MNALTVLADALVFAGGALLLTALVGAWQRPLLSRRVALAYAGLALAFFSPALLTPAIQVPTDIAYQAKPWGSAAERGANRIVAQNPLLSDVVLQMLPFRTLVRERLLGLEAPLWAHEIGTGQPLLGNAQSSPFAPLHLLALPLPPLRAMTVAAAWQVLLGLLLTHLLARLLGACGAGAALAAVGYAFSTFAVAWCYYPLGMTAAFLPGVLAGIAITCREAREPKGPHRGPVGLALCALSMALSGHPETLAHAALLSALVVVVLLFRLPSWQERRRFLIACTASGALAFGLAAPALLPILEVLPESERSVLLAEHPAAVAPVPVDGQVFASLVNPLLFGSPRDHDWRGPGNFNEVCSAYAGALLLGLALAGAAVLRGRVLTLLAGGGFALAGALGLPPIFPLLASLPVVGDGAHARLRLFWILAVALAAGLSCERLRAVPRGRWVAVAACAGVALALTLLPPRGAGWQSLWHVATLTGLAASALAFALPRLRAYAGGVALAALVTDLFLLGMRYNPTLPAALSLRTPAILERVRAAVEEDRRAGLAPRVIAEGWDLPPNLASLYGLWDVRASDPMRPAEAAFAVTKRLNRKAAPQSVPIQSRRYDPELHRFLAIRYTLAPNHRTLEPPWEVLGTSNGLSLWRLPEAGLPFFFPERVHRLEDPGEVRRAFLWSPTLISRATWLSPAAGAGEPSTQEGRVRLLGLSANGFSLEVATPTGGIVTSSIALVRGWRVEVDGKAASPLAVQAGFLGIEVPPGTHRVELTYQPLGWRVGWVSALLSLLAALAWGARRYRSSSSAATRFGSSG